MDMRLGDKAARTGEEEPSTFVGDEGSTGMDCLANDGNSPPVSSKNGSCSIWGDDRL